jgi:FkbM family methyltransferase
MILVDIGSQIGTFTRFALGKGAGKVIAIEPDPTNNACFERTFEKEIAQGQVILVEAALWDSAGVMKFVVASRSDAGAVASEFDPRFKASRIVDVPTATLDEIVQKRNLSRVDYIKWAIGGATRPALRGAHQTLSRFRPRMAMLTNSSWDDPVVLPRLVLEALPSYDVLTQEVSMAYFY